MSTSSVRVTEGNGPFLWTDQRSVASVNREAQYVLLAEPALPTFSVVAASISTDTTTYLHVLQIMAGSTNYVRIHKIVITQQTDATAGGVIPFSLIRLTSAGTGGTSITPRPFDTADTATATAMSGIASGNVGAGTIELMRTPFVMRQTVATSGTQVNSTFTWEQSPRCKPIIIAAGTSNGVAIKTETTKAGATVTVYVEFTETAFL